MDGLAQTENYSFAPAIEHRKAPSATGAKRYESRHSITDRWTSFSPNRGEFFAQPASNTPRSTLAPDVPYASNPQRRSGAI